jgi:hypothetical protein
VSPLLRSCRVATFKFIQHRADSDAPAELVPNDAHAAIRSLARLNQDASVDAGRCGSGRPCNACTTHADQTARDHQALVDAVAAGKLPAQRGI